MEHLLLITVPLFSQIGKSLSKASEYNRDSWNNLASSLAQLEVKGSGEQHSNPFIHTAFQLAIDPLSIN